MLAGLKAAAQEKEEASDAVADEDIAGGTTEAENDIEDAAAVSVRDAQSTTWRLVPFLKFPRCEETLADEADSKP